jgi:hypothetical protein
MAKRVTTEQVANARKTAFDAAERLRQAAGSVRLGDVFLPGGVTLENVRDELIAEQGAARADWLLYQDLRTEYAEEQAARRERSTYVLAVTNTLLAVAIMVATCVQAWSACSAERRAENAAHIARNPMSIPIPASPSASVAATPALPMLQVNNECWASARGFPAGYVLHARIDTSVTGDVWEKSAVWYFNCDAYRCLGAELDLDPWLEAKPLGYTNVKPLNDPVLSHATPDGFVIEWGPQKFTIDAKAGRVTLDADHGTTHQHGSARCSFSGVPWPATEGEAKAETHAP